MLVDDPETNGGLREPPQEDRVASATVREIYRQVMTYSGAERWFFYRRLCVQAVGAPEMSGDVALLHVAAAAEDLGTIPSKPQYDGWRARQAQPRDWMPSSTIRSRIGSWAKVKALLGGQPLPDPGARRLLSSGREFGREHLVAALRASLADHQGIYVSTDSYVVWAREASRSGRHGRVPRSVYIFQMEFGSWLLALRAAGLTDEGLAAAPPGAMRYTDEEIIAWVREAAAQEDLAATGGTGFARWRRDRLAAAADEGEHVFIPSLSAVTDRFRRFADALIEAGVLPQERRGTRRRAASLSDEDLITDLREATCYLKCWPGRSLYDEWRPGAATRRGDRGRPPASASTVRTRLGGWPAAARQLVSAFPELASLEGFA